MTGAPVELPLAVERLIRRWEHRSARVRWSEDLVWWSPEVAAVAGAVIAGDRLDDVLFAFGHQRAVDGVGESELRIDLKTLADVLTEQGKRSPELADLLASATRGMEAATATLMLESVLVDPVAGFATPAGFVAALLARQDNAMHAEMRIYRSSAARGTWRSLAVRMRLAAALGTLIGYRDAATFVEESTMAVALDDPARYAVVEDALRAVPDITLTDVTVHHPPTPSSVRAMATWLLQECPPLVDAVHRSHPRSR